MRGDDGQQLGVFSYVSAVSCGGYPRKTPQSDHQQTTNTTRFTTA